MDILVRFWPANMAADDENRSIDRYETDFNALSSSDLNTYLFLNDDHNAHTKSARIYTYGYY